MKRNKVLRNLLIGILILVLLPIGAAAYGEEYNGYPNNKAQQYTDVPTSHWAFKSIDTCSERGWFNGYQDGSFHPSALIRRDEAAKVFVEALALPWDKNTPLTFTDTAGNWAAGRIEASKYLFPDATNLAGTKSFRPTQTITREETIYALVVAWQYASKVDTCDESVLNVFADGHSISFGVRPYLAVAVQEDLINGMPGKQGGTVINAQKGLTRAEFATMLARALEHGKGPDDTSAPQIKFNSYPASTPKTNITLTGKVVSSALKGVSLTCDGESVQLSADGGFSVNKTLVEGENSFNFVAINSYGGSAKQTVNIQNAITPTIRILSTIPEKSAQKVVTANGSIDQYQNDCVLYLNRTKVAVNADGYFEVTFNLVAESNAFELTLERKNVPCDTKRISIALLSAEGAGQWMQALPEGVTSTNYMIEKKTQYRSKIKQTQTSNQSYLPGWELVNSNSAWGDWSGWTSTPITASANTEVNTRQVEVPQSRTVYNYDKWSYINSSSQKWQSSYAQYTGPGYQAGSGKWEYLTTDTPLQRSGVYDGQQSYVAAGGWRWWHESTSQVAGTPTYATEYQYRNKDVTTNTFTSWGDWSSWGDGEVSANDSTQVESRTMYRFTLKTN